MNDTSVDTLNSTNNMEIIPAIMPHTFSDIEEKAFLVKGLVPLVQIDIMDGKLTKHSTWPYKEEDDAVFDAILREEQGLPYWEEIDYEIDLMVKNPEEVVHDWLVAGATRIIVHVETITAWDRIVNELRGVVEIGLAINVQTPIEALEPYVADADFIQCMGIRRIGFQGEPFDEEVVAKIESLREKYPEKIISVDGGVNLESAPMLLDAGATRLVAGSAIFKSGDVAHMIAELRKI